MEPELSHIQNTRLRRAARAASIVLRQVARNQTGKNMVQAFKLAAPATFERDFHGVTLTCFGVEVGPFRTEAMAVTAWAAHIERLTAAPLAELRGAVPCT